MNRQKKGGGRMVFPMHDSSSTACAHIQWSYTKFMSGEDFLEHFNAIHIDKYSKHLFKVIAAITDLQTLIE